MAMSTAKAHEEAAERVRNLVRYKCLVDVNPAIPVHRYYRSGREMIRMANVYYEEGKIVDAFILYSKFITLFVEKLKTHPDIKQVNANDRKVNKEKVKEAFKRAEELKPKLQERFEKEELKRLAILQKEAEELGRQQERQRQEQERKRVEEEASFELAKRLQEEEEQEARKYQEQQYRKLQEQERNKLNVKQREEEDRMCAGATAPPAAAAFPPSAFSHHPNLPPSALPPNGMPNAPVPSYEDVVARNTPLVPSRDLKPRLPSPTAPPPMIDSGPMIDRTTKPDPYDHFMSTGTVTGNKFGLRDVIVPTELMVKFTNLALPNTTRNTETLGLLCGTLSMGQFRITHLVIPKQSGTPDSCNMEGEEEIFDLQDKHDLITLGWIHTHPTQTAFLSSVDLHTHFPYQQMLPEAIAIVCAPKYQETGCFYLTPDYGLKTIGNCREKGFHYHAKEPPLFEECSHVKFEPGGTINVLDLRK